jgi:HlyD family secretion protein
MKFNFHIQRLFKPLYITWVLASLLLILIVINFRSEVSDFYGIAESSEVEISFESATIIKQLLVVPGQIVTAGQLLMELERPELTVELNRVRHRLEEITADREIWLKQTSARIAELQALQLVATSELDYQLQEIRARYHMNLELTAGLISLGAPEEVIGNDSTASSPILLEIERLKTASRLAVEPYQIQIACLEQELQPPDPQQIEINRLSGELILLEAELAKLTLRAETTGLIGAVNFKNGETVPPYITVLTLHSRAPLFVSGYIHENSHNQVTFGQSVKLLSLTESGYSIPGEIVGVGSRIIAFPGRLAKRQDVTIWGREVMIRILEDNEFLLGEKILVRAEQ